MVPEDIRSAVRDHGGGYVNHSLFWTVLAKDVPFQGAIKEAIERDFGSYEAFKKELTEAAKGQFGSGWAWLAVKPHSGLRSGDSDLGTVVWDLGTVVRVLVLGSRILSSLLF